MAPTFKVCQKCSERNNPSFSACWKCGAPFQEEKKAAPVVRKKEVPRKDYTLRYQTPVRPKQNPPVFKYSSNPFCVLGLTATCSSATILQRVNETKVYSKLGTVPKFRDDIPFLLDSVRSEDSIRAAQHALENPKRRLVEEMFWFWDEGEDNKVAFKLLTESELEKAEMIMESALTSQKSKIECIAIKHNLIILKHSRLIKKESSGEELTKDHWLNWTQIIGEWMTLIASDSLWEYVSDRAKALHFGIDKNDLVQHMKSVYFEDVLRVQEELIHFYVKNEDIPMLERHAAVLLEARLPTIYYKKTLNAVLQSVEVEITGAVSIWRKEFEATEGAISNPEEISQFCERVYLQLIRRLEPSLVLLIALDPQGISDAALAGESYAEFLRNLAIKLSNQANQHSRAKVFMREARRFAINEVFKNLLDSEIQTLDRLTLAEDLKSGKENELLSQITASNDERGQAEEPGRKSQKSKSKSAKPNGYSVAVRGNQIFVPPECNCCLGKADQKERVSYEYQAGNTKHTISFDLPICKSCFAHRTSLNSKITFLVLIATSAGVGCGFIFMRIWPFSSAGLLTVISGVVFLFAYFIANKLIQFSGVSDSHGSSESSVRLSGGFGIGRFEFSNPAYAMLFAAANNSEVQTTNVWRHARERIFPLKSKSNAFALGIAATLLIVGLWSVWAALHATLYVDNGYGHKINLNLNNGQGIYEIPNGISTIEVPVANLAAEITNDEKVEKIQNLNISSLGSWIFNPGRINSYSRIEIKYGSVSREPQDRELGNPLLFQANADYIFERPPQSISTKSGGEIRSVILHSKLGPSNSVPEGMENLKASIEKRRAALEQEDTALNEIATRIDNYKKRISEIESLGNVQGELLNEYNAILDKANSDIREYNPRLEKLNQMKEEFSSDVKRYNDQIKG